VSVGSLRYPACNAHAPYCHLWSARLYNIFPYYLINGTIFEVGGRLLNTKCVFWFSLQLLFEAFLILRRNERDIIKKMYIGLHVKYTLFLPDFNDARIFLTDFLTIPKHKISWKSDQWEPSCSTRMDMMKLTATFRNFANAPKNVMSYNHQTPLTKMSLQPQITQILMPCNIWGSQHPLNQITVIEARTFWSRMFINVVWSYNDWMKYTLLYGQLHS
jgi:hypothetical protein